jgi:hypothetical protein
MKLPIDSMHASQMEPVCICDLAATFRDTCCTLKYEVPLVDRQLLLHKGVVTMIVEY